MKVILEILSAFTTTMTIVDAKDLKFRPFVGRDARGFLRRLDHI